MDNSSLLALISATLRYDAVDDCFLMREGKGRGFYPIGWPAGTVREHHSLADHDQRLRPKPERP